MRWGIIWLRHTIKILADAMHVAKDSVGFRIELSSKCSLLLNLDVLATMHIFSTYGNSGLPTTFKLDLTGGVLKTS